MQKMTIEKRKKIAIYGFIFSIFVTGLFLLGYYCFR